MIQIESLMSGVWCRKRSWMHNIKRFAPPQRAKFNCRPHTPSQFSASGGQVRARKMRPIARYLRRIQRLWSRRKTATQFLASHAALLFTARSAHIIWNAGDLNGRNCICIELPHIYAHVKVQLPALRGRESIQRNGLNYAIAHIPERKAMRKIFLQSAKFYPGGSRLNYKSMLQFFCQSIFFKFVHLKKWIQDSNETDFKQNIIKIWLPAAVFDLFNFYFVRKKQGNIFI